MTILKTFPNDLTLQRNPSITSYLCIVFRQSSLAVFINEQNKFNHYRLFYIKKRKKLKLFLKKITNSNLSKNLLK